MKEYTFEDYRKLVEDHLMDFTRALHCMNP